MTWHLLAATAAVLGVTASVMPQAQPVATPEPELTETEIINLENERYRRMTVPVSIGEEGPFQFMIDTGAQATVLSQSLADQLMLHDREPAVLVGMASRRDILTTSIPDVRLGSRSFFIQTAPLVPQEHIGSADGILGLDSLQNQRVMIDFDNKLIAVADAEELGGNRGYEIIVTARQRLGQLIITEARIDGINVAVIVDTGAQGSIGNLALLERLRHGRRLDDHELTDINGVNLSGPVKVARELRMGGLSLHNFPILFTDSPPFHGLQLADEPALILGMSELKLFRRVAIDFKSRKVLFDLPRSASLRDFDSMYGRRMGL